MSRASRRAFGVLGLACLVLAALLGAPGARGAEGCELFGACASATAAALQGAAAVAPLPGIQPPGRRCGARSMRLGWQDDDRLLYRQSLGTAVDGPFDGGEGERQAEARIDTILERFAQAGGCVVRFVVHWGATENNDGTWYFDRPDDRLDEAVRHVRDRGFRVLLTLSGSGYECIDSGGAAGLYNPKGRACSDDPPAGGDHVPCGASPARPPPGERSRRGTQTQVTAIAPVPRCFARFVGATVAHFRGHGVELFSLWNEPNHPLFLQGTPAEEAAGILPADRYRELYRAGYGAAMEANPRAKVLLGELSSGPRRRSRLRAGEPRRTVGALDFLSAVAAPGGELHTDGVAWHPYQHGADPGKRSTKGFAGVGDADRIQTTVSRLGERGADGRRRLSLPGDGGRPPLLFTEFGYLIRADPERPTSQALDDRLRARWFARALERSRTQGAGLIVLYTGTEYEPAAYPPYRRDDYGIFAKGGAVRGTRGYGRGDRTRRAYCDGILDWATRAGYPVAPDDPATPGSEGPPC